jgi:hypothetical protein
MFFHYLIVGLLVLLIIMVAGINTKLEEFNNSFLRFLDQLDEYSRMEAERKRNGDRSPQ